MASEGPEDARFARSVQRARALIAAHPAVTTTGEIVIGESGASLEFAVEVPMRHPWKAAGESPSGVRRIEPLRLDFRRSFPLDPPEVSLRPDFGRTLAHVQPWTTADGRPVPCIHDGQISEFFQQQGLVGMLNQTLVWLDHAAEGRLIDPQQGWEPTRRDFLDDYLVVDPDALRALVNRQGGHRFQRYDYIRFVRENAIGIIHGEIHDQAVPLNAEAAKKLIREKAINDDNTLRCGKSLALVVWPGKEPSGKEVICGEYTPETVTDLASLKARAALFGCAKELEDALAWLARCAGEYDKAGPFSLAVVLCARRPFHLIGSPSPIELCSYLVDFFANNAFPDGDATPVRPAGHRDRIAPSLLVRMANVGDTAEPHAWSLVGAGSLGSKLALHMARAGRGPQAIIDKGTMSPHNYARHALIPRGDDMQILSMDAKARLLSVAVAGFGQAPAPTPLCHDVCRVLEKRSLAREAWPKKTWAIVNATASLRVRAALVASTDLPARVIEGALYAQGTLGMIAAEGPDRNPNSNDLIAEFYALFQKDASFRETIFGTGGSDLARVATGEGCGSVTMRLSDARISHYGAALAEYMLSRQQDSLPTHGGELLIGCLDESGLGVSWRSVAVPPVTVTRPDNGREWTVRVHARAMQGIQDDVARWPHVETGGILVGRQDEVSSAFHVVDVIEAPPDSQRSPIEFVLGTEGLNKRIEDYASSTNWSLYCLGTWHSHLAPSGPSNVDRQTARAVALARLAPSVLLIHTPRGFRALIADRANMAGAA